MNRRFLTWFLILAVVVPGVAILALEEAEAKRFGGGSSVGSRGSRSFSSPSQSTTSSSSSTTSSSSMSSQSAVSSTATAPSTSKSAVTSTTTAPATQSTVSNTATAPSATQGTGTFSRQSTPATTTPRASSWGSGLMGGIGGFLLGGMLGSMLFGEGVADGFGLLDLLLIGGGIWLLMRWLGRRARAVPGAALPGQQREAVAETVGGLGGGGFGFKGSSDEVSAGLALIHAMDPRFDQGHFLQGARIAFERIQAAWSDWNVTGLQSLLTDRMWNLIQRQAAERKAQGRRDMVEKIRFLSSEISEAWQEAGEDWLTVHFVVEMIEYETDTQGQLLAGDPHQPVRVEEFWSFTRPVASPDPNWRLAAVQQPGEVARGAV